MNELRRNLLSKNWMVIRKERISKESSSCPFRSRDIEKVKEIRSVKDKKGDWIIKVVPEINPLFQIEGQLKNEAIGFLYDKMNSIGASEIIIEARDYNLTLTSLPLWHLEALLKIWQERIEDLKKDLRFRYILLFKNEGTKKSIEYPFSQLLALPFVPKRIAEEIRNAQEYFRIKERCIFCDMTEMEISNRERLIEENAFFISFIPFAPRFPFEMWILPKEHSPYFEKEQRVNNLGLILQNSLRRIEKAFTRRPTYVIQIHTAENERLVNNKEILESSWHWHIEIMPEIMPKEEKPSDFDRGAEIFVSDLEPEEMASQLREIM